jgi:hypothetical protein
MPYNEKLDFLRQFYPEAKDWQGIHHNYNNLTDRDFQKINNLLMGFSQKKLTGYEGVINKG